nr:protein N-lysine methyltransferase METTL21D-like isoform X4 [Procambarus clarkii]
MMFTRQIEFESIGKSLYVSQESEGDAGSVVWDAAIVLAKYFDKQKALAWTPRPYDVKPVLLSGCHVVELGSGTGCVGLTAALLGASKVTITDLPQFLPLMRKNIHQNQDILECVVDARELTWGNLEQGAALTAPDVLVLADCIYYEEFPCELCKCSNQPVSSYYPTSA